MKEKDKDYYNNKIDELYNIIESRDNIIKSLEINICALKVTSKVREELIEKYKTRINKAIEYIKNNTMYFDSEIARDFGELCPIEGAGDTRIHCVIGDKELLEILKKE